MAFSRKKIPFIKQLASLKITVACLLLLFVLTLWGTIAQVDQGLYAAQSRFFNSWVFLAGGFIPFPGAQLVLWVFFINLASAMITRLVYHISQIGIIITHAGILLFFVGAFVTFHGVKESYLILKEGQASNVSLSQSKWQLSVWENEGEKKQVLAYDLNDLRPNQKIDFGPLGLKLETVSYYPNSVLQKDGQSKDLLKPIEKNKEPSENLPGAVFKTLDGFEIVLFSGDAQPKAVTVNGKKLFLELQNKRFVLPFTLKLVDFTMENYPGTSMARNYQSKVEIQTDAGKRDALIYMNNPLRYGNHTFYQSSYNVDKSGQEYSVLAVVENSARLLPYIATFVTFFGLAVVSFRMAFLAKRNAGKKSIDENIAQEFKL